MTTATTVNYQISSAPVMWGTDIKSQLEEFFNIYWAAFYEQIKEPADNTVIQIKEEDIIKLIGSLHLFVTEHKISPKNLEAIRILEQWFAEPDDLGEKFWNEFCEDLEKNRFTI